MILLMACKVVIDYRRVNPKLEATFYDHLAYILPLSSEGWMPARVWTRSTSALVNPCEYMMRPDQGESSTYAARVQEV